MCHSRPLLLYLGLFNTVDNNQKFYLIVCRWLDSNCGPLMLEATAIPTGPQPLSLCLLASITISFSLSLSFSFPLYQLSLFAFIYSSSFSKYGTNPASFCSTGWKALTNTLGFGGPLLFYSFFLIGPFPASFSLFSSFQYSWQ